MNAQTQISAGSQMNSVGLLNLEAFELSQRVAKMLSSSTLVPEQYRAVLKVKAGKDNNGQWVYRDEENPNGLSNCVIALNMANRMGADPLMIMQNLYLIEGRPSWSSQFIMASINSCGRFSSLRFDLEDLGEKEVEYQETQWNNGRKNVVNKKIKIQNLSCTAWVIERESGERLESSKITIEMAVKEGWYQKNGSKWQTMPEQMLRYRAASFFGRVYAPELLMGLRSAEEEQDVLIDVTPEAEKKNTAGQVRALKQKILAAKSLGDLDKLEGEIAELHEEDWDSISNIFVAQRGKFLEEAQVVDAELIAEEAPKEKAEIQVTSEPKTQSTRQTKSKDADKLNSMAIRKDYLVRMNKAETLDELNEIQKEFDANDGLATAHLNYLKESYEQLKEKLTPVAPQKSDTAAIDPIKSNSAKAGLERMIADCNDVVALEAEVARAIKGNESKLTAADHQAVLMSYAHRKEVLSQQDIFGDEPNIVDLKIKRIKEAKTQDEINEIFADPSMQDISEEDMTLINQAADLRESEIQG